MPAARGDQQVPRPQEVFISYSRKDKEFVRRLHEALSQRDREAWVDWEDIRPTEEFMQAIYGAIEGADTFVFVLTPDSVASEVCGREIAHAAAHNKRMVPIVARDVDAKAVPEPLAKLNWIFSRASDDFEAAAGSLVSALDTDLEWVHAHTRLLTRAIEWEANKKSNSFVLRGEDLRSAEQWLAQAGAEKERQPTALQTEYIIASRKAAARRQRITLSAVTFGALLAVGLAIVAFIQRQQAIEQKNLADQRRAEAERATQVALSRQLAAQSELLRNQHPTFLPRSVLLAAEAMQRFPSIEADLALRASVGLLPRRVALMEHDGKVCSVAITSDGEYVGSGSEDRTARIWEVATGKQLVRMEHPDTVKTVLLSSDGKYLATIADSKLGETAVRLWSLPAGQLIAQFPYVDIPSIVFSPNNESFAVASPTGIVVCDTGTGRQTTRLPNASGRLAFSPNGKSITNGEQVWDITTGKELSRITMNEDRARAVAFSPDGKYVATGTPQQMALLWDATTGRLIMTLRQKRQRRYAALEDLFRHDFRMTVSFSRDGKYLATAGGDIQARVWDLESQREIALLPHEDMMSWAAFTRDGQRVLTTGEDRTVRLWEAFSGHELTRITEGVDAKGASEACATGKGKYIAVAGGNTVSVWEGATGESSRRFVQKTAATDVTFSRDGKLLATCDATTARVWDVASGELIAPPMVQKEPNIGSSMPDRLKSVAFSADGKLLATANGDHTARIWDVSTGREIARIHRNGDVQSAFLSPDGKFLVTAGSGMGARESGIDFWEAPDWHLAFQAEGGSVLFSPDGHLFGISGESNVRILEVANRKQISRIDTQAPLSAFVFSPDSKYVAIADDKGAVGIFEIPSGRRVATLKHEAAVGSVTFSRDGKYVATISGNTARIWDSIKGTELHLPFLHETDVTAVAFTPDGTILATAAGNNARVWDAASGVELARINHDQLVTRVAFSPDGKTLATAGDDGVVQLSLWRPQDLLDEACARLTRNLTPEEWHQYLGDQPYRKTCPALP
jgi:WD40 repeat protein